MQLIDFPFQELCFLSPGSAFLSRSYFSFFLLFNCILGFFFSFLFFGQVKVGFVRSSVHYVLELQLLNEM